jgi:hypothetical protein
MAAVKDSVTKYKMKIPVLYRGEPALTADTASDTAPTGVPYPTGVVYLPCRFGAGSHSAVVAWHPDGGRPMVAVRAWLLAALGSKDFTTWYRFDPALRWQKPHAHGSIAYGAAIRSLELRPAKLRISSPRNLTGWRDVTFVPLADVVDILRARDDEAWAIARDLESWVDCMKPQARPALQTALPGMEDVIRKLPAVIDQVQKAWPGPHAGPAPRRTHTAEPSAFDARPIIIYVNPVLA